MLSFFRCPSWPGWWTRSWRRQSRTRGRRDWSGNGPRTTRSSRSRRSSGSSGSSRRRSGRPGSRRRNSKLRGRSWTKRFRVKSCRSGNGKFRRRLSVRRRRRFLRRLRRRCRRKHRRKCRLWTCWRRRQNQASWRRTCRRKRRLRFLGHQQVGQLTPTMGEISRGGYYLDPNRVEIEIGMAIPTFWPIGIGQGNPPFWNFEAIRDKSRPFPTLPYF